MRYANLIFPFFLFICFNALSQNEPPTIIIQEVIIDEENQIITIQYDLSDEEDEEIEVFLRASSGEGQNYTISTEAATGDIGFPITPGNGKEIVWPYTGEIGTAGNYQLKLIADDHLVLDPALLTIQVDSNLLKERLENIVGVRHYISNPDNLDRCRDTLESSFQTYGLETFRQNFPYAGTTGQNIIGTLSGTTDEEDIIIIDGHYDTVSNAPGADDNGSATVAVMEAARILSQFRFKKSLRFIGFDLEEAGLRGSIYYVDHLTEGENIEGVLNMEMIAYYSDQPNSQTLPNGFEILFPVAAAQVMEQEYRGNFITNTSTQNFASLGNAFYEAAATYAPALRVINVSAPDAIVPPDLLRSDHAPFWEAGIPALMLTDGANFRNPNYHQSSDTVGTLNFTFMSQVVQAIIGTAAELAEPQHSTEALASIQITVGQHDLHELDCLYTLSPIPAREQLLIQFGECHSQTLSLELISPQGNVVHSEYITPSISKKELKTGHLPSGTYWLRLSDGHHFSNQKIILL